MTAKYELAIAYVLCAVLVVVTILAERAWHRAHLLDPHAAAIARYESHLQIWHCEDGAFQLRTRWSELGRFPSKEEAQAKRHFWAERAVESDETFVRELPPCGKRVD